MLKQSTGEAHCKASNFQASRSSSLGVVSSYPVAALAVGFFVVTCYVIFKDIADGAPITPDHVMSFAVLVGTFASGHLLWDQLKQWRLLPALGLTILFAAGTFYCVTASGGRNAAAQGSKAAEAHKTNDDRARIEGDLKQAKERLVAAQDAEAAECASGDGPRCKGWRKTREERQTHVNVLEAQLRLMEPKKQENPELRHAAKVFAAFPGVTASEQAIFGFLVLYWPFLKAVFCEIATLVFASIGFSHRKPTTVSVTAATQPAKPLETVASRKPFHSRQALGFLGGNQGKPSRQPFSKQEALNDLLTVLATNGAPSQEALRDRWGVKSKGTVSKWLKDWEAKGRIKRHQSGRCKEVASA